jgi:hypothetical protein
MSEDYLNYERFVEEALREVIRKALAQAAAQGLHDGHYFHITFRTNHPGVDIPAHLRLQYPDEMPVILQNAFWDLEVGELGFSVSLSFNRVQHRLTVPFDAITIFHDPHPEDPFRLQFQMKIDEEDENSDEPPQSDDVSTVETEGEASRDNPDDSDEESADKGAKIVTLDAFRNK